MSFVDLHIHSRHSSDGEWSVARIFREAAAVDLAAFAIADHDSVAALPEAFRRAPEAQAEYLPNVEISTFRSEHEFHLLSPLVDHHNPELLELLETVRRLRVEQTRRRVEKLQQLGFEIEYQEIAERLGHNSITGPAIAGLVLEKESNRRRAALGSDPPNQSPEIRFYKDFFRRGKPAYVPKRDIDLGRAIQVVRQAGGVPVLAHPGLTRAVVDRSFLAQLKEEGLEGLEAFSSYHDSEMSAAYTGWARELDLVVTAGSDFHGRFKPQVPFASMRERGYEVVEELRARRERMD